MSPGAPEVSLGTQTLLRIPVFTAGQRKSRQRPTGPIGHQCVPDSSHPIGFLFPPHFLGMCELGDFALADALLGMIPCVLAVYTYLRYVLFICHF